MAAFAAGAVVLVPFPFSDLSHAKLRPAIVLANVGLGDVVLCQITSNPYVDPNALTLRDDSFTEGSLQRVSYARPGKLFTAHTKLIVSTVGVLKTAVKGEVVEAVIQLLRASL